MQLTINGQPTHLDHVITVALLLEKMGFKGKGVAVEINRQVVPKRKHAETSVKEGDTIEIVTFVGGG